MPATTKTTRPKANPAKLAPKSSPRPKANPSKGSKMAPKTSPRPKPRAAVK